MSPIAHAFARYLPTKVVTNDDLAKTIDTTDEWIQQRSGIKERRFVESPQTTSDLGTESAKRSLSQIEGASIDCIIAATLSADYDFPGIGVLIQSKLGLPPIPAFDIRNQCSGFLYSLELAAALINDNRYKNILVVGAEVHSTGLDLTTRGRDIAVLFGDGAGSCVVSKLEDTKLNQLALKLIDTKLHSDGAFASELWCQHIGSANFPTRITSEMVEAGEIFPKMNGKLVFEHAVKRMSEVSKELLEKNGLSTEQIKLVVPHQANIRINLAVAKALNIAEEKCFNTITNYGNTTAATIPIGLSHALEEANLVSGEYILSCAFGSGFTWGAAIFQVA